MFARANNWCFSTVRCDEPTPPENGRLLSVTQRTEGSAITFMCNDGFQPTGERMAICSANGTWIPDPEHHECIIVNCTVPEEPSNGTIVYVVDGVTVNYEKLNETVEETTVLTYQCDSGLSLTGPNTITCTNAGVWSIDPREIMCVAPPTTTTTSEPGTHVKFCCK